MENGEKEKPYDLEERTFLFAERVRAFSEAGRAATTT